MPANNIQRPEKYGHNPNWGYSKETLRRQRLYSPVKTIDPKTGDTLKVESNHDKRFKNIEYKTNDSEPQILNSLTRNETKILIDEIIKRQ